MGYGPLDRFRLEQTVEAPEVQPQQPVQDQNVELPKELTDGTYRVVPSAAQLTEAGRLLALDGKLHYWAYGQSAAGELALQADGFSLLVNSLGINCSVTVQKGRLKEVILRPSTVSQKPSADVSALTAQLLGDAAVTFSVNTKQSKTAGGVTPGGTTVTVSASVTRLRLDLGGQAQLSSDGTAGMATLEQGYLTLDPDTKPGDYVQLGIRQEDGTASLRIIRKTADTWTFAYQK